MYLIDDLHELQALLKIIITKKNYHTYITFAVTIVENVFADGQVQVLLALYAHIV